MYIFKKQNIVKLVIFYFITSKLRKKCGQFLNTHPHWIRRGKRKKNPILLLSYSQICFLSFLIQFWNIFKKWPHFFLKLGIRKQNMTGFVIFCHLQMYFFFSKCSPLMCIKLTDKGPMSWKNFYPSNLSG